MVLQKYKQDSGAAYLCVVYGELVDAPGVLPGRALCHLQVHRDLNLAPLLRPREPHLPPHSPLGDASVQLQPRHQAQAHPARNR